MQGRFCRIELLDPAAHADDLYDAYSDDAEGRLWTYMVAGPFESRRAFLAWLDSASNLEDPMFHAIVDASTRQGSRARRLPAN